MHVFGQALLGRRLALVRELGLTLLQRILVIETGQVAHTFYHSIAK